LLFDLVLTLAHLLKARKVYCSLLFLDELFLNCLYVFHELNLQLFHLEQVLSILRARATWLRFNFLIAVNLDSFNELYELSERSTGDLSVLLQRRIQLGLQLLSLVHATCQG